MPRIYNYEPILDKKYWSMLLARSITDEEQLLFKVVKTEHKINNQIDIINQIASNNGLYIPYLTNIDGNCLFESLKYLGLVDNALELRRAIAEAFILFQDVPDFPQDGFTMKSYFEMCFRDIEYMYCEKTKKIYKYNYTLMCRDLANNRSWNTLPTELILIMICYIYNVKIQIVKIGGNIITNEYKPNQDTLTFHIGHIGSGFEESDSSEFHYIPLKPKIGKSYENTVLHYNRESTEFHLWAKAMCDSIGLYVDKEDKKPQSGKHLKITETFEKFKIDDLDLNNL
jgi:hypothetical protein